MARMPDINHDLGPVEGFAHRAEHAADRMRELMRPHHADAPQPEAQPGPMRHLAIPRTVPQPAAEPPVQPIPTATTEEPPMSLADDITSIKDHFKAGLDKFEQVDHEALTVLDAIQANDATKEAFAILGALTGLPAADFSTALAVLRMVLEKAGGQLPGTAQQ